MKFETAYLPSLPNSLSLSLSLSLFSKTTPPPPPLSSIVSLVTSCSSRAHLKQTLTLFLLRHSPSSSYLLNSLLRSLSSSSLSHLPLLLYSLLLPPSPHAPRSPFPDKFTFPIALRSAAALSLLHHGRLLHQHALCFGLAPDPFVSAALVHMYSSCGDVASARKVFDAMPRRDRVSWTSMASAYAHNGCALEALEFVALMRRSGVAPGRVGLLSALLACARLGASRRGECFHGFAVAAGFEPDVLVATALVDMYAKCGDLVTARSVFDRSGAADRDVVCWSAMIAGYGYHGCAKDAILMFDRMVEAGVRPNYATFTSLLSACSHSRMVEDGRRLFDSMQKTYSVEPKLNHYACMVDILGRAGELYEAEKLIEGMPVKPDSSLWGSLLGACRIHGNLDLGERIADRIFELDPNHSGYYVLLSNIYAAKSRWSDVERVRKLMVGRRVNKEQGFSLIEFNSQVYKFGVGDRSHPQSEEIYAYLEELIASMKQLGYVPLVDFMLHDVEDESKEAALLYHSEKLAVAYGLINLAPGSPIRITKNLRICGDCHTVMKFISKIVNRVIVVRDVTRFHHFKNGSCSCRDYW
ncbi:pentatricopeptide repeat-containing protein At2g33760-like [Ananas comosus]|uniref:Pentatricopeptide repeat-containing protein At2g33760-like n=1 Tax=Ananas comosus TaxID=4615 RepID=A0A6P5GMM1_ANACO|nr:pentatricopeptide repeat-containing protein At2g33760-like [Ananas comosus]